MSSVDGGESVTNRLTHTRLEPARAAALRRAWLAAAKPGTVLLDAGDNDDDTTGRDRWRHTTLLLASPVLEVRIEQGVAVVREGGDDGAVLNQGGSGAVLDELLAAVAVLPDVHGRFAGGLVGFFGYEHGSAYERVARPPRHDLALPEAWLGVYDEWLEWRDGEVWHGRIATPWSRHDASSRLLDEPEAPPASQPYAQPLSTPPYAPHATVDQWPWVRSTHSRAEYEGCVAALVESIHRGDLFQANLSQRFTLDVRSKPPAAWYARLVEALSPGFGAFLAVPSEGSADAPAYVLSASPERFWRIERDPGEPSLRKVRTDPIKGTRPRAPDAATDRALAEELLASEKDRAENRMIVDLMRNDLSRVCEPGSIRVPRLLALQTYPAVHHLVSTVEGRLRKGIGVATLLAATFPAGSITGAPKVQAMHEIRRHEPYPRGPYTGSVGYLGFDGTAELSVAIRTVTVRPDGYALVGAGGGIVAQSEPEAEYAETLVKARALLAALQTP